MPLRVYIFACETCFSNPKQSQVSHFDLKLDEDNLSAGVTLIYIFQDFLCFRRQLIFILFVNVFGSDTWSNLLLSFEESNFVSFF